MKFNRSSHIILSISIVILSVLILSACFTKKVIPAPILGDIDATSIVAIGGNSYAGYADDALHLTGQENSVVNIIVDRMNNSNEPYLFTQPLLSSSSYGINENGESHLVLGYKTDCNNETSLSPVRELTSGDMSDLNTSVYSSQGPFYNLGVAGLRHDQTSTVGFGNPANGVGNYNPYFARMARDQANSSVLSDASILSPTFLFLSLGDEDILRHAKSGGVGNPIPPAGPAAPGSLIWSLEEIGTELNTDGVISNIPNILNFPYFTTIPYDGLDLDAEQTVTINSVFNPLGISFVEGPNGFTMEDANEPFGVRKMVEGELILLSVPLDSVKCFGMGSITPIPDEYVLSLSEIAEINSKISEYNIKIQEFATAYDYAFVDAYELYTSLESGIVYNGVSMNAEFVTGGFYSLDGINLNPIGQALLANKYIEAMNEKYNAQIPFAPVTNYPGVVFP